MSLQSNRAIRPPTLGHAGGSGSEVHKQGGSFFRRGLSCVGRQPKPRVDSTQFQEHMVSPSCLSCWKPSKPTLDTVLENWVAQAEGAEKSTRQEAVESMKQAGAHLSDGKIVIPGDLNLTDFHGLTSLPKNLTVDGKLLLIRCTGLMDLPQNLKVGGNFFLTSSTGLTSLSENLKVGGNLSLRGCTGLTSLPENLTVGGTLSMNQMHLDQVPEHLEKVRGLRQVNLYANHIRELPARLGELPADTELIVVGNPIPDTEIDQFRAKFSHIRLIDKPEDPGAFNVHPQPGVSIPEKRAQVMKWLAQNRTSTST